MAIMLTESPACFESEAAQIHLHPLGFLQLIWLPGSQASPALRAALEALLYQMQRLHKQKVLVNPRNLAMLSVEDNAWYLLDWLPRATQQYYRYAAVLSPTPLLHRINIQATSRQAMEQFPVVHQYFEQESSAVEWLLAQE